VRAVFVNVAIQSFIKSRRFWASVSAIAVPILNEKFGWGLSEETLTTAVLAVVGWIVGESLRSSEGPKDVTTNV
jgi:hypothetical protein